jgi:putative transcriptional regulator
MNFSRWMRKTELTDEALCGAVREMSQGLIDADLGGGVVKKRVGLAGRGKRKEKRCRPLPRICCPATARNSMLRWKTDHYRRFAMTTKTKAKSRILEAVHETAADLHRLGFIDQRKMRKYDALCLDPIPEYDSEKIRSLRDGYQLSQTVLASLLNISPSTVRQWELGDKHPSGPSQKLLNLLERKGLEALI